MYSETLVSKNGFHTWNSTYFITMCKFNPLKHPLKASPCISTHTARIIYTDWIVSKIMTTYGNCKELTHWKDSDAGRDWGQEEKGTTEDEMAGWHRRLDGCEFEWTPGVGDGQGGLACCDSWGRKESDTTEWLNWTDGNFGFFGHNSEGFVCGFNHEMDRQNMLFL